MQPKTSRETCNTPLLLMCCAEWVRINCGSDCRLSHLAVHWSSGARPFSTHVRSFPAGGDPLDDVAALTRLVCRWAARNYPDDYVPVLLVLTLASGETCELPIPRWGEDPPPEPEFPTAGLTPTQEAVVQALREAGEPLTMAELVATLHPSAPNSIKRALLGRDGKPGLLGMGIVTREGEAYVVGE